MVSVFIVCTSWLAVKVIPILWMSCTYSILLTENRADFDFGLCEACLFFSHYCVIDSKLNSVLAAANG